MNVDQPGLETALPASRSKVALDRYRMRMRRRRSIYAVSILVAALVLVVLVKIAYSAGEISHATLHSVKAAPATVALHAASSTPHTAWTTSDDTALGEPYWGGTIITHDEHTVRGRDARTGRATWAYTRSDRTVCAALQDQGVTIAVFELHGNCDELTALNTATGARTWERTLDKDGAELNGRPRYSVTPYTVMFTTPGAIYAIDPSGGLDRWVFKEAGCTIHSAVLGGDGALISQSCRDRTCTGVRFCANGSQLLLRDATAGDNTDSTTNKGNPDQIKWNLVGSRLVPASTDQAVTAVAAGGDELVDLDVKTGSTITQLPLDETSTSVADSVANDAALLRIGTTSYALYGQNTTFAWHVVTGSLPTVTSLHGNGTPNLSQAVLAVTTSKGIAVLDPLTGTPTHSYAVAAPARGSRVYPFGTGFLVAGSSTVLYR